MNAAYENLIQHLDDLDVRYESDFERRSICADFRGETGTYRIIAQVDDEDHLFQVFGYASLHVPVGSRPAIAEAIARANYGLRIGKFELDVDDGEIRFHVSQILPQDELDDEVIVRLIGASVGMLDIYMPAVLSVVYGNELPRDAIRCVEAVRVTP